MFILLDWIPENKICWHALSANPNAIHLLEKNPDKIVWSALYTNSSIFTYERKFK